MVDSSKNPPLRRMLFCSLSAAAFLLLVMAPALAQGTAQAPKAIAKTTEIPFKSHDGYDMLGRLTVPDSPGKHPIVIYMQTAEGMTIDVKRTNPRGGTFNYFDLYREKLPPMNVAFFSYEGRGIRLGDDPPRYEKIDWNIYNTSTLENKVRDALTAIQVVSRQPGIDPSRVFLIGASEGTLIASETASRARKEVAGLILYGVMSGTMRDTFKYILTGGAYLPYRESFDTDKDGKISKAEFEADPHKFRQRALRNASFETFDVNKDGFITEDDIKAPGKPLLDALETDNYALLNLWAKRSAGVSTPENWFKNHFEHPPIWTFLSQLDIPIGFFQGVVDPFVPVEGVRRMEAEAKKAGKTKWEFHYFDDLEHSLGIAAYFTRGVIPEGHKAIFEFIAARAANK